MSSEKEPDARRPWDKPEVKVIELTAEEVMAVGCKQRRGGRAAGGRPNCGLVNFCSAAGS